MIALSGSGSPVLFLIISIWFPLAGQFTIRNWL
jgi:hypothetical protein